MIYDFIVTYWPAGAAGLGILAATVATLRYVAPKTKTDKDDKLVAKIDASGIAGLLKKFNPFKRK